MAGERRKVAAFVIGTVADAATTAFLVQPGYSPSRMLFARIATSLFLVVLHTPPVFAGFLATTRIRSWPERIGLRGIVLLVSCVLSLLFFLFGIGQQISRGVLGDEIHRMYFSELQFMNQSASILAGEIVLVVAWSSLWPRESGLDPAREEGIGESR